MYTGTLIEELMKTVERAEERLREADPEIELEHWYATQHQTTRVNADLLGVA
jgi:hypothetical protein